MTLIEKHLQGAAVLAGSNHELEVGVLAAHASKATYSWSLDNRDIGHTQAKLTQGPVTVADAGIYAVTVTVEDRVETSSAVVAVVGGDVAAPWPNEWESSFVTRVTVILGLVWVAAVGVAVAAGFMVDHWTPARFAAACTLVLLVIGLTLLLLAGWLAAVEVRSRARKASTGEVPLLAGALFEALGSSRSIFALTLSGIACLALATTLVGRLLS